MSSKYSYNWQSQPYISWKGKNTEYNTIVGLSKRPVNRAVYTKGGKTFGPSQQATSEQATTIKRNSRLNYANKSNLNSDDYHRYLTSGVGAISRTFGPQPLKQWRLQLNANNNILDNSELVKIRNGYNKITIATMMDKPGAFSTSYSGKNYKLCEYCNKYGKLYLDKEHNFEKLHKNFRITLDAENNTSICVYCNGGSSSVIKPSTTVLSKKYFSDTNAYLKNRCKTYDQKLTYNKIPSVDYYDRDGVPKYPDNNLLGPQTFYSNTCIYNCPNNTEENQTDNQNLLNSRKSYITIYKPNNRPFAQQGAVSSSTRLAKLKYDTINTNGASFMSAFGREAANAGKYSSNENTIYFTKSKNNICDPNLYHINGNKNIKCR